MKSSFFVGIDAGSTTFKVVVLDGDGRILHSCYERVQPAVPERQKLSCQGTCQACGACIKNSVDQYVRNFFQKNRIDTSRIEMTALTGSQINDRIKSMKAFRGKIVEVSEISAHVAGTSQYHPDCRAIVDVGGQDSKAMVFNEASGLWDFKMSGICAAGTGGFIDTVSQKLGIAVESMKDNANLETPIEFSTGCAVFTATSVNKFKNLYPIRDIVGAACRAQAKTIMSGVGSKVKGHRGTIFFQGGVASNPVVVHFLRQVTGNDIVVPENHKIMGALGAALLARERYARADRLSRAKVFPEDRRTPPKSAGTYGSMTLTTYLSKQDNRPVIWKNLFFPPEILHAFGARVINLTAYTALFSRDKKRINAAFDSALKQGYGVETCSVLKAIFGFAANDDIPEPDFLASTSLPCTMEDELFLDIMRRKRRKDRYYALSLPSGYSEDKVAALAVELENAVRALEAALGVRFDPRKLGETFEYSNMALREAQEICRLRLDQSVPAFPGHHILKWNLLLSEKWGTKPFADVLRRLREEIEEKIATDVREDRSSALGATNRIGWVMMPPFYTDSFFELLEYELNSPLIMDEFSYVDWEPLDIARPFESLARRLLSIGTVNNELRLQRIAAVAERAKLNGVVLYNHFSGRCPMCRTTFNNRLVHDLGEKGIPVLVMDGDSVDPTIDPCSSATKFRAFVESLNKQRTGSIFG